jgi:hypothetical protein
MTGFAIDATRTVVDDAGDEWTCTGRLRTHGATTRLLGDILLEPPDDQTSVRCVCNDGRQSSFEISDFAPSDDARLLRMIAGGLHGARRFLHADGEAWTIAAIPLTRGKTVAGIGINPPQSSAQDYEQDYAFTSARGHVTTLANWRVVDVASGSEVTLRAMLAESLRRQLLADRNS